MRTQPSLPRYPEDEPTVLLARDRAEHWSKLRAELEAQSIRVLEARTLCQTHEMLDAADRPILVFTAVLLADGDWEGILRLAKRAGAPVVVVSTCLDARFCLDVLERGALDFIVPPFDGDDIAYVLRNVSRPVRSAEVSFATRAA